ncbi:MAG: septum site-determining protein MinC [Lachnospiraceae bacterium]|nr:septum site-determining protein MinC [Lachnospiraceae bacterium]
MKEKVRIKSFPKGLNLILDDQIPFDDLIKEVAEKFATGKNFFGDETVALSFSGRKLTEEEQIRLMEVIEVNCFLKILCIVEKDEEKEKLFVKCLRIAEARKLFDIDADQEVQVFRGSLQDGEDVDTPTDIVIFGDVQAGCSIVSEKSILVLGGLYGTAKAGKDSKDAKYIVAAMEMAPEELCIGELKYEPPKKSKWGLKKKDVPMVAKIQGDAIVLEEMTKEHLKDF